MKKILSIILTLAILVSSISNILVFASDESTALETGDTVVLYAFLSDNPGVSELVLSFEYDSSAMNLVKVTNGEAMNDATYTGPKNLASGCMATWYYIDEPDYFKDGSLVALEFEIVDSAAMGNTYPLSVVIVSAEGASGTVFDLQNNIRVIDYRPGDVNGDGIHSLRYDVSEFNQYIVDGCKYDPLGYAVQINENAADVNNDGVITIKDVIDVNKYIVDGGVYDPNGYAVKLYPHIEVCKHTSLTAVPAKEATCTENGNTAYWVCENCDKLFGNANGSTEITIEDTVVMATHTPGDEATCTEPQTCTKCGGVLKVANGHTEVTVPGYDAEVGVEGLTDGIKCSVCGDWVVEQTVIPPLAPATHSITYFIDSGAYIDNGAAYLQAQTINNPNPTTYSEGEMVILQKLSTPGYVFNGWVDQSGARWDAIPADCTQNLILYASWTQDVYTVSFDTPDVDVYTTYKGETLKNKAKYTIDTGLPITNPETYGYTFLGWSNDDGFIVKEIKAGTTGNLTLHANWTSNRNRAVSYSDYGDPIIIEDNNFNQFLFVYNIGRIDNVPLYTYKKSDNSKVEFSGATTFTDSTTFSTEFGSENVQNIVSKVANATTRNSGWTLSEGWNSVMEDSGTVTDKQIQTEERTDTQGNTVGGKYFVSNSEGGSSYSSVDSGSSSSSSGRITTEDSFGINTSYDKSTEKYCDAELKTGFKNETELSAGISAPIGIAKVEAGVKNTTTITADAKLSSGRKDNEAFHVDTNASSYVGTEFTNSSSSYYNATTSNSTNWNSETGYEKSEQISAETSVLEAIGTEIGKSTTHSVSKALSGITENKESVSGTSSNETGYSNTVIASRTDKQEKTYTITKELTEPGYHRLVEAGVIHVYGVVGYDIATASYYTFTFNLLDDTTYQFWDYSSANENGLFNDCENGVVNFEIPYEVNEYIAGVTGQTQGLEIEIDDEGYGCVTGFEMTENFEGDVVVPQYLGVDNLDDTQDPVVVTSFDTSAFRKNTEIKTVILPMYVTQIPDYAFEGCTNLETVIAFGVTEIGEYAFKDCENLGRFVNGKGETEYSAFMIDNKVTKLGKGAFEGVNELKVMAYDADVADAAINPGAKKITVDLSMLKDEYSGKKEITSAIEYFGIIGGGKTFSGLKIKSDATETFISNMTLVDNIEIPLELSSGTVTLARVTVENAPGIALNLSADNTDLKLYRTVTLTSNSGNSVLSKNVTLSKANSSITGTLDFSGNYLVCGEITNTSMLKYPDNVKVISVDEYDKYLSKVTVLFDTDGGSNISSVEVGYETKVNTPNDPKKDHYSFLGWYTDEDCTTEFNFDTPITSDTTLYAKWKLNEFNVSFNANGGNVSQTAKEVIYGEVYGTLPTPSRTGYSFNGWYTSATGGTKIAADTTVSAASDHTLYAQWTLNTYKVSWSNVTGVTISVKRTESPYANAQIGSLSSGNTVNYGDVLSVTYSTQKGYTKTSNGKTTLTVTGNITSEHIYANATLNSYKVNWTVPTGGSITVKRTSSPLAGATTGTLSSGNTVYHGDVLAITYSANTGYSVATKGKTSVTVAGNITNSDIYLTVTPNDYTYNIVYKSSNGTALGTDTVTKAFATTNTVTPKTFAGYDTPASQSVKWDATSKTITFTYTPTSVAPKTISKSKVIRYIGTYVSVEAVVEHQNRTKDSVQIRINWTVIHNGPNNPTFSHGITAKATIGSVSNTTKITSYISDGHVKDQRYSKASDWITVPLDSTQASSINIAVSTWQTNSNGTNISSGGGSNYTNYTDTWSIDVPAY